MLNCKRVITQMNLNEKLQLEDGTKKVGGLIYLTHTTPNIRFSVGVVLRFMSSPSRHHFGAVKRILRYIVGTLDFGFWYYHVTDFKL